MRVSVCMCVGVCECMQNYRARNTKYINFSLFRWRRLVASAQGGPPPNDVTFRRRTTIRGRSILETPLFPGATGAMHGYDCAWDMQMKLPGDWLPEEEREGREKANGGKGWADVLPWLGLHVPACFRGARFRGWSHIAFAFILAKSGVSVR